MVLEDVSIYGDLWLAVNIRFRAIGTVERVKLTVNYAYFQLCFGSLFYGIICVLEQDVRRLEQKRPPTDIRLRPNL